MAEIVIKTVLELGPDGKRKLRKDIEVALASPEAQNAAKASGRKIGSMLSAGIETGRNRSALERSEAAHIRRLEALHLRSASQLEVIERRKAAQIDLIRERAVHQEQARMKRLEFQARQSAASVARSFAAIGALGVVGAAVGVGRSAFDAARDIDRTRSSIAAMTGSLAAANEKLAELRRLSQESIGVTNQLATSTFAAFKALGGVTDKTINDLIRGLGRLNAAFGLDDVRGFTQNLQQLFNQGFERSDVKEALGRVPIFEQLLESAFGTKDPDKLRKLKAAGTLTMDTFAAGIAAAIEQNAILKSIPESVGARFDKVKDRILTAIAPVGDLIGDVLIVATNRLAKSLESLAPTSENSFNRFRFALQETVRETDRLIGRVQDLYAQLTSGFQRVMEENTITATQMAAVGAGFFRDLLEGRNPLAPGSRANTIGRLNELTNRGVKDPRNIPGAPSRDALIAAQIGITPAELAERRRRAAEALRNVRTGGGGGTGSRTRFIPDFGLGETAKLEHEAELARIRRANLAVVLRRQALPEGIGLPTLPLTAAGQPEIAGFPEEELRRLERAADELERLPNLLSDSERLMRGFNSQIETAGDAFERFGANVSRALLNVRDLFASLKRAVLDFFNDLIGSTLQNLVKSTLSGLFGGRGGGGIGNLFNNLFRTPSFAGGGDGISAPPSISQGIGSFFSGGGGSLAFPGAQSAEFFNVAGGVRGPSFLGGLGKSFAGAAPLLGLGLGGGLGGQSTFGSILGSAGGFLGGGSIAGFSGVLGAKAAAFFTNPFTIGIGAALLVGSVLLGKASQRRRDEEASGQFLTQALQGIEQLAAAVGSGQITTLAEARSVFDSQILGTFKQQISGLKTKSVRDSRLTNQVRDLENVFQARIPPLIAANEQRQLTAQQNALNFSRQIPEFATGGIHARGGLAVLHPGEMVLTQGHQAAIAARTGPDIFRSVGVPGIQQNARFEGGGIMPAGQAQGPMVVEVDVNVVMGKNDQTKIFVTGGSTDRGRQVIVRSVKTAQTNREL